MKGFFTLKKEKTSLHFRGRKISGLGLTATVMGGIGWLIFLALSLYSAGLDGNGEQFIGIIGILDAVMGLVGVILAYRGLQERDVYYALPIVGLALNGILFIVYFSLYFMGIAVG